MFGKIEEIWIEMATWTDVCQQNTPLSRAEAAEEQDVVNVLLRYELQQEQESSARDEMRSESSE